MPRIVWVQASNPKNKYVTTITNDPNVPAGYVLTTTADGSYVGVDGLVDDNSQKFVGGLASGGFPQYSGYGNGEGLGKWPNGHLGGD